MRRLEADPSERYDIAAKQPEVVGQLLELAAAHGSSIKPAVDQLAVPLP